MPVTLTALSQKSNSGTLTSLTSAGATFTSGDHLVVVFGIARNATGTTDWAPGISVTDTQGLEWTVAAVATVNNGPAWDVAVGIAIAESDGAQTEVTVTPGVESYAIQLIVLGASGAAGTLDGMVAATTALSPSAQLDLTLGDTPTADDQVLFLRYWSAGGGGNKPTLTMEPGWSALDEVLSVWDYAGSLAAYGRSSSTSTSVSCTDPWATDGSTFGGAALALVLRAPGAGPVVVEASGAALSAALASLGALRVAGAGVACLATSGATGAPLRVATARGEGASLAQTTARGSRIAGSLGRALAVTTSHGATLRRASGRAVALASSVVSWLAGATRAAAGAALSLALGAGLSSSRTTSRTVIASVSGRVCAPRVRSELHPMAQVSGRVLSPRMSGALSTPPKD